MEDLAPDRKVELADGINLSDLLQGNDVVFTLKNADAEGEPSDYEPDDLFNVEGIDELNLNADLKEVDYGDVPFETIKVRMTKVTDDGSVMKKVLREGIGEIIPSDALVRINYDGYFELSGAPFDSSTLRGKAEEFIVGCSGLVPGLDIAVSSMRNRERSEFLLQPSVAYGKLGCPPRIPRNAEVIFIIEVMAWKVGSEAAVSRALANSRGEKEWEPCKAAVRSLVKEAISLFNEKRFKDSKIKLQKAKDFLEKCHLKGQEEEDEQKSYMFKVSLNLAMAFNQLQGSSSFAPSAIINCKDALKIKPNNGKAHLQWGIALMKLGELSEAEVHLLKAKRLMNSGSGVDEHLEKLESKKKSAWESEKAQWKRALGFTDTQSRKEEMELSPEAQEILNLLQEFKAGSQKEMVLPSGVTSKEKKIIQDLAGSLNLDVKERASSFCVTKM